MKRNLLVIKLVLSVVILMSLVIIFINNITGGNASIGVFGEGEYKEVSRNFIGNIQEIVVDTVVDDLTIITGETDVIKIEEKGNINIPLEVIEEGNRLVIRRENRISIFGFNYINTKSELKITIPEKEMATFNIESVSGDIQIIGLNAESIKLETVSGDMWIEDVYTKQLELETVAGDVEAEGLLGQTIKIDSTSGKYKLNLEAKEIEAKIVSGDIELQFEEKLAEEINIVTVAGDVELEFPEKQGFEAVLDATNGTLKSNRGDTVKVQRSNWVCKYGDEKSKINVQSTTGDLKIK